MINCSKIKYAYVILQFALVKAPLSKVWEYWTNSIFMRWNAASMTGIRRAPRAIFVRGGFVFNGRRKMEVSFDFGRLQQ